ncbi:hypothetical protein C2G38_2034720 [Gigaspora rosea]|uniref:Uncharacterized protein n=1 Tax=Gigaspora rosea TaxID=44941 RepID=A0A397VGV6_9GLOM|nr:hypothetical protein C2G38_2034720 [Gigaspora rosea]
MPIHASIVVFITTKNENNAFTQGMAQYQSSENTFATVHWKRFNDLKVDFSVGDIVSVAGKFVIENSEQFITIASATIVNKENSKDEFDAQLISLNTPHVMFNVTVTRDLKTSGDTVHFGVETHEYNSCTGNRDIHMPITVFYPVQRSRFNHLSSNLKINKPLMVSGFLHLIKTTVIMVEATDVDFLKQETNYNITKNPFQTTTHSFTNLDRIAEEIHATTSLPIKEKNKLLNTNDFNTDNTNPETKNDLTDKTSQDSDNDEQEQKTKTECGLEEDEIEENSTQKKTERGKRKTYQSRNNDNDEINQLSDTNNNLKRKKNKNKNETEIKTYEKKIKNKKKINT